MFVGKIFERVQPPIWGVERNFKAPILFANILNHPQFCRWNQDFCSTNHHLSRSNSFFVATHHCWCRFALGWLFYFVFFFCAAFFLVPGSMLSCFSDFLLFCFSAFLLFCFSAFLLLCFSCFSCSAFLLFVFPASLLFCFLLSLLICFSASLFSLLLCFCASVPFYFYYSTCSFLQSCVFAALLPAPLLLCFLSLLSLCFSFSFALFCSVCILNETLERP